MHGKDSRTFLRRCPHHGLPLWLQVQTFYNGVNPSTRQMIDAAADGTINNKTPEDAYEFIEDMSLNNYQWQVMRTKPTKIAGVYNIDSVTMLSNQVELLNKKIDGLFGSTQVHPAMRCDSSGGGVPIEYPPFNPTTEEEQVNYMGNNNFRSQNNPYSNTYNAGWKNHPNFFWGGQQNQRPQNPQNFQQPPYQQEKKPNLEEMLSKFISTEPEPKQENVESKGDGEISHDKTMPNSAKFLKELLTNKRKLDATLHAELNTVCSAILKNKLSNKLKDSGSFTISCLIGSLTVNNALADLGTTINVMPYKMFKRLGLGKPKQTRMSIQLADKTVRFHKGIIEDVLVKIDKFIYPVDFVVLDMDEDNEVPLILGRLFLATAKTIINVGTGELTLRAGDDAITLQARDSVKPYKTQEDAIKPVGDKVLLDATYPNIVTTTPNEEIPLAVLSIFPFGTIEGCDKSPRPCDMAVARVRGKGGDDVPARGLHCFRGMDMKRTHHKYQCPDQLRLPLQRELAPRPLLTRVIH
ncbi:hypothetical protein CXB51_033524 [Gossypium anomalum]|uniref:Aspartic peptidase DDI1-type domain-containing protein n=1 Tax=Gossypium anomalum TaxID=47600 RepID=A0A8J5Y4B3_9ROSI|nr:hypothetical protein CXB51_033524 [Gossypium anomalum]